MGQGVGSPKLKVSTNVALSGATAEKAELWNEASGCVWRDVGFAQKDGKKEMSRYWLQDIGRNFPGSRVGPRKYIWP